MLEFRNVTRRFGDLTAVDNVSLAIAPGQMVGVIGRSGAGKSTLLRMVNRLCEPTSGEIYWADKPCCPYGAVSFGPGGADAP